ncbi:hypothetical protein [Azospirillum aestuarii]|uniref:hypothetical protein n=1 Tax=Azospirillum aestuarii TaxID=2802052 RepID=UPI004054CD78
MRTLLIPAVALAMFASSGALAQSQQSGSQQPSTRSYKDVENALKQAGIQDVQTLNAAYLVSAVTKQGEQVTFVVDPPPATGSSASNSGGQQSGNQSGSGNQQASLRGQQQVRDDLTKAGFTNVQILDATYLAMGKTKNGDKITMMIDPTATVGSAGTSNSKPAGGQSGSSTPQSGSQKQ